MTWGGANRPITSNVLGTPQRREGTDGDIQIRQTNLGAKLFGKLGGRWHDAPLSIDGVTRIGTTLSDNFNVSPEKLEFVKDSKSMLSITNTGDVNLTGKIILTNADLNTCIGVDNSALGRSNIAIGVDAGASFDFVDDSTVAFANVCIGHGSGESITVGYFNTTIGLSAGNSVIAGYSNTLIGHSAGALIEGGNSNVCIGKASNVGAAINESIAIGLGATTSATGGIAIGKLTTATGLYGIAIGSLVSAATNVFVFGKSGNYATSSTFAGSGTCSFAFASDERRKTDIKDAAIGLDFINELKARTFKWKPAEEHPEEWHAWSDLKDKDGVLTGEKEYHEIDTSSTMHGFIAQELKEVLDKYNVTDSIDVWAEDENGMQRASESKLIIPLTKAVQELSAKVDTMQTEINNLKEG